MLIDDIPSERLASFEEFEEFEIIGINEARALHIHYIIWTSSKSIWRVPQEDFLIDSLVKGLVPSEILRSIIDNTVYEAKIYVIK